MIHKNIHKTHAGRPAGFRWLWIKNDQHLSFMFWQFLFCNVWRCSSFLCLLNVFFLQRLVRTPIETSLSWPDMSRIPKGIPNAFPLRSQSELFALGRSFELLLQGLGNDRDRVGDAIYGAKTANLVVFKELPQLAGMQDFHKSHGIVRHKHAQTMIHANPDMS